MCQSISWIKWDKKESSVHVPIYQVAGFSLLLPSQSLIGCPSDPRPFFNAQGFNMHFNIKSYLAHWVIDLTDLWIRPPPLCSRKIVLLVSVCLSSDSDQHHWSMPLSPQALWIQEDQIGLQPKETDTPTLEYQRVNSNWDNAIKNDSSQYLQCWSANAHTYYVKVQLFKHKSKLFIDQYSIENMV